MRQYLDCDVRFDDDTPATHFRGGRVTVNGNNATIWRRSTESNRFEQVDRLTEIAVTESHGKDGAEDLVIAGRSTVLARDMGLRGKEAVATARVHSRGGCATC
jgi:type V secretory pathway adhesin AidA